MAAMACDPDHADLLRKLAPASMMIVPLTARGRNVGCLSLARVRQGCPYTRADLARAEEFAKRAAVALDNARLYREAQEANRVRDEFLGTVSHELRTPLNAILGWARMLRSGQLNEVSKTRALATIERNAMLQARLIEDLLDASRIVVGKLRMERRVVDLVSAVRAAVDVVRPFAMSKSVEIVTLLDRSPIAVTGDLHRLQQIFWNLLSNAIKFTPSGGVVEVRLERAGTEAKVFVRDTGEGIRTNFLPHAFDRFRQGDSTTTRRHGGLGLGLAIVRHLVELHAGSVCADSPGPGLGATFTVTLPLTPLGESGVVLVERITPLPGEHDSLVPTAG
jgi:signal transduction histidine kinase